MLLILIIFFLFTAYDTYIQNLSTNRCPSRLNKQSVDLNNYFLYNISCINIMLDLWMRGTLLIVTYISNFSENPSQCLLYIWIGQLIFIFCSNWARRKSGNQWWNYSSVLRPTRKGPSYPVWLCGLALSCQGHRQQSKISKKIIQKQACFIHSAYHFYFLRKMLYALFYKYNISL